MKGLGWNCVLVSGACGEEHSLLEGSQLCVWKDERTIGVNNFFKFSHHVPGV